MKKVLWIMIPIGLVALLFTAHLARSQGFHGHHGGMVKDFMMYRLDKLSKQLNLDAAQQAKMDSLKQDLSSIMDQRRTGHEQVHKAIKAELAKDNPDMTKIQPMIDQQIDDMAQAHHQIVARFIEFYGQLKPEQKKVVADHLTECFGGHGQAED
jgi:Spy/CpxP family protein refolding chaperone